MSSSSPTAKEPTVRLTGVWRPATKEEIAGLYKRQEEKIEPSPAPKRTTARMSCAPHLRVDAYLPTPRKTRPRMTAVCPSPETFHRSLTNPVSSSGDDSDDGPLTKKKNVSQKSIARAEKDKALTSAFKASRKQNVAARRALPYTPVRAVNVRVVSRAVPVPVAPVHVPSHDCILEGLGLFFANRQPPAPE
jgi:hypothetical protein